MLKQLKFINIIARIDVACRRSYIFWGFFINDVILLKN